MDMPFVSLPCYTPYHLLAYSMHNVYPARKRCYKEDTGDIQESHSSSFPPYLLPSSSRCRPLGEANALLGPVTALAQRPCFLTAADTQLVLLWFNHRTSPPKPLSSGPPDCVVRLGVLVYRRLRGDKG